MRLTNPNTLIEEFAAAVAVIVEVEVATNPGTTRSKPWLPGTETVIFAPGHPTVRFTLAVVVFAA